ncbi:MAG: hypothetical protein FWE57_11845 [Chitinispirillia bacterium]|nr:hypothetical protein [Chitinispirillia bacterium]
MSVKRLSVVMLIVIGVFAFVQPVSAQKRLMPGSDIYVAKSNLEAQFRTIQAAVNFARPGEVIEILDEEVYEEQVTIDSTKRGITIRYIPTPGVTARPTIRWHDTQNTSTVNSAWETNGALRILNALDVTIEGVIVDGGGPAPFGQSLSGWTLFHGNAAIAVVNSARVNIRDCDLRNAYYGVYVKDRNVGGIFGNLNPHDNDDVIPLSRYGMAGGHLIEYNKIHNNAVGLYFESLWDLGSTVRYNLIYHNFHKVPVPAHIPGGIDDKIDGAIVFKDSYLSPVAIYNNTFFDNNMNLIGKWQFGYQHLIFNNIFGMGRISTGNGSSERLNLMSRFHNRMKHCVFSAAGSGFGWSFQLQQSNIASNCNVCHRPLVPMPTSQVFIGDVRVAGFGEVLRTSRQSSWLCGLCGGTGYHPPQQEVLPGAIILPDRSIAFSNDSTNRWLEMEGFTSTSPLYRLPVLFKSVDPESPDFLVPDWDREEVQNFIREAGWPDAGIVNVDGKVADLGAIPFRGKRPCDGRGQMTRTRARGVPVDVVRMDGNRQIQALFFFEVHYSVDEPFNNPRIKYIRRVAPIPYSIGTSGYEGAVIPTSSIHRINELEGATVREGLNIITFTLPTGADHNAEYGFIELVVEGTDGVGRAVSSDVIFLPYRDIGSYNLGVYLIGADGLPVTGIPSVRVGEPITIGVRPLIGATPLTGGTLKIDFSLSSDDLSVTRMRCAQTDTAIIQDIWDVDVNDKRYDVYFTRAGGQIIYFTAVWSNGSDHISLLHNIYINVLPEAVTDNLNPAPTEAESAQFTSALNEPSAPIHIPPVTGNAYLDAQGFVHTLELVFNDSVGENWIHYMRFVFSPDVIRGTMYDIDCINYLRDPNIIRITMGCAFPGAVFTTEMVNSGTVAVNYSALMLVERDNLRVEGGSIIPAGRVDAPPRVTSVLDNQRIIPNPLVVKDTTEVQQTPQLSAEFTAGPNPVSKQFGAINFFWQGKRIQSASLKVFDASGNVVNRKINIRDAGVENFQPVRGIPANVESRRIIGTWNLTDRRGRPVSEGTYLVRGVIMVDGKRERVAVMVGVR